MLPNEKEPNTKIIFEGPINKFVA